MRGKTKAVYPDIRPETMASLSELLNEDISVQDLMLLLLTQLKELGGEIYQGPLTPAEEEVYEKNLVRMIERNEKVFG